MFIVVVHSVSVYVFQVIFLLTLHSLIVSYTFMYILSRLIYLRLSSSYFSFSGCIWYESFVCAPHIYMIMIKFNLLFASRCSHTMCVRTAKKLMPLQCLIFIKILRLHYVHIHLKNQSRCSLMKYTQKCTHIFCTPKKKYF